MFLLEIFLKNKFSYSLETPNIKPRMGFLIETLSIKKLKIEKLKTGLHVCN